MKKLDLEPTTEHNKPQTQLDDEAQTLDNIDSGSTTNQLDLETTNMKKTSFTITLIIALIAAVTGIATGYGGYRLKTKNKIGLIKTQDKEIKRVATEGQIKAGDTFGVKNKETFVDQAEGYLEKGGLNGEGSHKLLRAGGSSQNVYLTSSVTDLDRFVGMEIKIWGETFKGQEAGWLMDVGRVEVVEVEGQIPSGN